ncbi:MAG TPA: DUF6326 family protein [Chryseolinea sp.]|nr:DUF6326 family protein [Chryseolinea sp.]
MANTNQLEDFKINVKFKLSALWTAVMFCYIYGDYFSLYVPGQIEDFINGKTLLISPLKLLAASVLMTIPPLMIFLSLTLKPSINRWSNVIFGTIYTIIMMLIALDSLQPWWAFMVFFAIVEIMITSAIVRFAWKWPKQGSSVQ